MLSAVQHAFQSFHKARAEALQALTNGLIGGNPLIRRTQCQASRLRTAEAMRFLSMPCNYNEQHQQVACCHENKSDDASELLQLLVE